ncbi:uncharacterized protein LOC128264799 [Drosophila gunungcola]|uniref:Ashwin n=1 Tax=Drosophila gunungcola TaxID=103775 RepID=A0A9P9YC02_9MUSC|nr:uncharacterized protein LOC128264799 [Drosophila gunungcola]KAI8034173.1 hypothetical protein M5D96_013024 [Drosophila gunungcola]
MDLDLSRADIIEQLKKREIYLPNVEKMPPGQLEEIYRGFVVPRPRRERDRSNPISNAMDMEQLTQRIKSVAMVGQKRPHPASPSDDAAKQIKMDLW